MHSPSFSSSLVASQARAAGLPSSRKRALTSVLSLPGRTMLASAPPGTAPEHRWRWICPPGLPGDAGHPRLQIELEKLDDGEVVDGRGWVRGLSMGQHYHASSIYWSWVETGDCTPIPPVFASRNRGGQGCQGRGMGGRRSDGLQNQPAYLAWAEAMREATSRGSLVVSGWLRHTETVLVEPGLCTDLFARMRQDDPYPNPAADPWQST